MDITTQVLGVQGKQTRTGKVVYYILLANNAEGVEKVSAWGNDPEGTALATKAQQLTGQTCTLRVEKKVNGQYTNYNLQELAGPGESLSPLAMTLPTGAPQVQSVGPNPPTIPIASPNGSGGMSPEREAKIVRQSCLSTAFGFTGHLFSGAGPEAAKQATEMALTLAKFLFEQVYGEQPKPVTPTPEAVAASVPGVQVGTQDLPSWL